MPLNFRAAITEHQTTFDALAALEPALLAAVDMMKATFAHEGVVYVCGNGGSAADAQHFAAELTGRFERDRRGYASVSLTTDTSALTAIGNDYGFDRIFSRQLESLGRKGDVLLAISTSGNSGNIIAAVELARQKGIGTIGLLGRDGGALAKLVDVPLVVPGQRTSRIQEAHIFILHCLCEPYEV